MADTSTKKAPPRPAEKSDGEKSGRTMARQLQQLLDRVDTLEDLAEIQIEKALSDFRQRRNERSVPPPEIIYGSSHQPCGCQGQSGVGVGLLEIAFWAIVGVTVIVTTMRTNRGE